MVQKGQYLERMTTVQSGELWLEALFHEGRAPVPALVASPHPALGGSMDSPVCAELTWALSRKGLSTLRFNYRGVGASQGQGTPVSADAADQLQDLRSAADHLMASRKSSSVVLVGYSFGAWVASRLAVAEPKIVRALVLVSPPTTMLPFDFPAVSSSGVPTLLVAGTLDRHLDLGVLREATQLRGLTLETVPEADHFFLRGLAQVGALAAGFVPQEASGALLDLPEGPDLELDR